MMIVMSCVVAYVLLGWIFCWWQETDRGLRWAVAATWPMGLLAHWFPSLFVGAYARLIIRMAVKE